jgi:phage/plasmid-like protein (TIGR03299 family)
MAHELAFKKNGQAAMAFVGELPWHGLGQELTKDAPIEVWTKEAGMDYPIIPSRVKFDVPMIGMNSTADNIAQEMKTVEYDGRVVLYRGDTRTKLSIVSDDYKIVQPKEILEFFRDLVATGNMSLETAGVLFGGTRYWAMANTNLEVDVIKNDRVKGRLLVTTSCDGTMATTAKFVAVRVVCNNTQKIALMEPDGEKPTVKVSHGSVFDPAKIKDALGLIDHGWEIFVSQIKSMAHKKITDLDAKQYIAQLILNKEQFEAFGKEEAIHKRVEAKLETIFEMYKGTGMGASSVTGTMWGAYNAVTEFADHRIGNIADNKLWNSWFGFQENLKNKAFELALAGI